MIAWLTHHLPRQSDATYHLPGGAIGGAEMTDQAMVEWTDNEVAWFAPDQWEQALAADRIVITGTDLLTDEAMDALSARKPVVWVHHQQTPSRARATLFAKAQPFVCMSKAHADVEAKWSGVQGEICHGWIDVADLVSSASDDRNGQALWAARNHPQKGKINARIWARDRGLQLTEMHDKPRAEVLLAMLAHTWFVFLPKGFDACPRTLIEAEAAGCQIATNENAGRRDPGDLLEVMAYQPRKFWSWV